MMTQITEIKYKQSSQQSLVCGLRLFDHKIWNCGMQIGLIE